MTTIYLIRHGQTVTNISNRFAGWSDIMLTDLGRRQAELARDHFKNFPIDAFYASTLTRAIETAQIIAAPHGKSVFTHPDLREIGLGNWEQKSKEEIIAMDKSGFDLWLSDFANAHTGGGETVAAARARFGKAIDRIAEENNGKTVLVVAHGGPIRLIESYLHGCDNSYVGKHYPTNVSTTTVIYENGVGRMESFSRDEYLEDCITTFVD